MVCTSGAVGSQLHPVMVSRIDFVASLGCHRFCIRRFLKLVPSAVVVLCASWVPL